MCGCRCCSSARCPCYHNVLMRIASRPFGDKQTAAQSLHLLPLRGVDVPRPISPITSGASADAHHLRMPSNLDSSQLVGLKLCCPTLVSIGIDRSHSHCNTVSISPPTSTKKLLMRVVRDDGIATLRSNDNHRTVDHMPASHAQEHST